MGTKQAAAPLVQTPVQLAVHSRGKDQEEEALYHTHASTTSHAHVALGDVVRVRKEGVRRLRGLVARAEQGVAVVLMDVHTQTPVHTYTLAPSDVVCTPPLVVQRSEGDTLRRTTYLGFVHGRDTMLWALSETLDARGHRVPGSETDKRTWVVQDAVRALFAVRTGELLAVAESGTVLLLADPLAESRGSVQETCSLGRLALRYDTQMLDAPVDTPAPHAQGALLCVYAKHGQKKGVSVATIALHEDAPRLRAYTGTGLAMPTAQVVSASIDASGAVAMLSTSGELTTAHSTLANDRVEMDAGHTVTLAPMRNASTHAAQLLFLSSSHLLLLLLPSQNGKERAAALIWDVDLDTVLAQAEWSLSGALATGPSTISATRATDAHVLVMIEAPHHDGVRSSVLALPVSVPASGLLVHALHSAAQTAAWVVAEGAKPVTLPPAYEAFISAVEKITAAERTAQLDGLFPAFVQQEAERLRADSHVKASRKAPKPLLPTPFVHRLLTWALPATDKGAKPTYAPATLRYLLERGVVSASMVAGDALVPRVRAVHDWTTLYLVLRHVPDLSEAHALAIVKDALAARADPTTPTVARVLQHVLSPPPFSKPALRTALRTHITDNDDVLILLDIVRCWLASQVQAPLAAHHEARAAEHERAVPHTSIVYRTSDVRAPPLEAVASFGEDVLDTYFPQLLSDARTHACLAECTRAVTHETNSLHTLARLSAPLDAFATAEKSKRAPKTDAKSKRLALHEASLLVPLYSRETLDV